jgi:hypothetical protein
MPLYPVLIEQTFYSVVLGQDTRIIILIHPVLNGLGHQMDNFVRGTVCVIFIFLFYGLYFL